MSKSNVWHTKSHFQIWWISWFVEIMRKKIHCGILFLLEFQVVDILHVIILFFYFFSLRYLSLFLSWWKYFLLYLIYQFFWRWWKSCKSITWKLFQANSDNIPILYITVNSAWCKSNLHKSNNRLNQKSIQVLFSVFFFVFDPM